MNQLTTRGLGGDPQDLAKIYDVRHVVATSFQDPAMRRRPGYGTRFIEMMQDVGREVSAPTSEGIQVQQSHSNCVLVTVDVQDLSRGIVFIYLNVALRP